MIKRLIAVLFLAAGLAGIGTAAASAHPLPQNHVLCEYGANFHPGQQLRFAGQGRTWTVVSVQGACAFLNYALPS